MEEQEMAFVNIVKDYPAILSKSQTPPARREKAECLTEIQYRYKMCFGKEISETQVMKKIHNMKSRIKNKTDQKKTGNIKIILRKWEEVFLKFMDTDDCNPTIHRIPGACTVGAPARGSSIYLPSCSSEANIDSDSTILDIPVLTDVAEAPEITISELGLPVPPVEKQRPQKRRRLSLETDETANLSNSELQRLVLLTQLKVLNKKMERLERDNV